jgi:hypothetical protein
MSTFKPVVPRKGSSLVFLSALCHTSLVSLSLVKIRGQDHNCLRELFIRASLSQSKISVSQSSDTSEYVSAYNTQNSVIFYNTPMQTMIPTERSYKRKKRGYLNLWALCCSCVVLRMWGQEGSVCLSVCL